MRRWLVTAAAAATLVTASAAPALAHHIPFHQHEIVNRGHPGGHDIALWLCKNRNPIAFDNFHLNVHTGQPGTDAFDNLSNPVDIVAEDCP